jgi:long-chain acyl-CoA synthetase
MRFAETLESFGELTAVRDDAGRSLTYAQLAQRCDSLNEKFGAGKKLVFILCGNNIDSVVGYLAALRGGHTVMMLDQAIHGPSLSQLIGVYDPSFLWRPDASGGHYCLQRLHSERHASLHPELALLLSTSGTTGSPRQVRLSLKNLYANAASIAEYLHIGDDDRPITTLPLHYSYGLSVLNSHLGRGAMLLLSSNALTQREFWQFFREQGATSFGGVPYTYEILARLRFAGMTLPSLRTLTQAGGRLSVELVKEFSDLAAARGIRFYVMYGQTEATARIAYMPPDKIAQRPGSVGIAIPRGRVWIENANQEKLTDPYVSGELVYAGDNVMMGYAECKDDLALPDVMQGVLRTGDLAYFDEEAYLYISGRLKRFLKMFGNRVNLDEIERYVTTSLGYEVACGGEDNHLLVAGKGADNSALCEIKQHIIARYRFHHSAVTLVSVPAFPVSASGKIQYRQLFEQIKHGQ